MQISLVFSFLFVYFEGLMCVYSKKGNVSLIHIFCPCGHRTDLMEELILNHQYTLLFFTSCVVHFINNFGSALSEIFDMTNYVLM
jgi:hypothetical protein